jgi:hypothetical protein
MLVAITALLALIFGSVVALLVLAVWIIWIVGRIATKVSEAAADENVNMSLDDLTFRNVEDKEDHDDVDVA